MGPQLLRVRTSRPLADRAQIREGSVVEIKVVEIKEEDGVITIETAALKEYALAELVAGITEDNRHGEVDTGEAVGNEG